MSLFRPTFPVVNGGRGEQYFGDVSGVTSSATSLIKAISGDSGLFLSLDLLESDSEIKSSS
jgi:hypothetical protein